MLGSLPRSRPSVRSPRRADAAARRATAPKAAKTTAEPAATGEPSGPREPAADEREKPHTAGPEADLERLARAGLSVAGGAAALGLRAAGRAAAALRDAVERR